MHFRCLSVVLTADCNLRCRYCYQQGKRRASLQWPVLKTALDALLQSGRDDLEVSFTGGEPLLAFPTIRRAVLHVGHRLRSVQRVKWTLTTNGTLLTDRRIAFLDAHGFTVVLSFDGVPAAQAARGRATFRQLDQLLDRLRRRHRRFFERRLSVTATVSAHSAPYLGESVEYFLTKRVRNLELSPVMGEAGRQPGVIDELRLQFERLSHALRRHYEQTGRVPLKLFRKDRPEPGPAPSEWVCLAATDENLTIDVDGQVYGCVLAAASYHRSPARVLRPALAALKIGRMSDPDFAARLTAMPDVASGCGAFQHPERRYSSYGRCADCTFLGRCHVCPLAAAPEPAWDDVTRVPDFVCAFNQVALAARDRFPRQPSAYEVVTGRQPPPFVLDLVAASSILP